MEVESHFDEIHSHLFASIESASSEIVAAVAWFTDKDIFDLLCKKSRENCSVYLLLVKDKINLGRNGLDFSILENAGGKVYYAPQGKGGKGTVMHNKFVVLDRNTVITGSYNWSNRAKSNDENITIISESKETSEKFIDAFFDMISRFDDSTKADNDTDTVSLVRHLGVIKNFLLLEELVAANIQLERLKQFRAHKDLSEIFDAIDCGMIDVAVSLIDRYIFSNQQLIKYEDKSKYWLILEIKGLELEIDVLTEEKTEIERIIRYFEQHNTVELGDLIHKYLQLRQRWIKEHALDDPEYEAMAKEATDEFENFEKSYQEAKTETQQIELSKKDQKELKRLYRRACNLCHPDKQPAEHKDMAHKIFVELQKCYINNDIESIRDIYDKLVNGIFSTSIFDNPEEFNDINLLLHHILTLRRNAESLAVEIEKYRESEAYKTLQIYNDLDVYFYKRKEELKTQISLLEKEFCDA